MQTARLPDLFYPFPPASNVRCEHTRQPMLQWLEQMGVLDAGAVGEFDRFAVHVLGGMMYPDGPTERLQLLADYLAWVFAIDARCDGTSCARQPRVMDAALGAAFGDLRQRLGTFCERPALEEFDVLVEEMQDSWRWEAENRRLSRVPSFAQYLEMEASAVAIYPCVWIVEVLKGIDVPPQLRCHPALARLKRLAALAVRLTSDVLAFSMKPDTCRENNVVRMLKAERGCSSTRALEGVARVSNGLVELFLEREKALPRFGGAADAAVRRLTEVLRHIMRGSYDWGRWATARFDTVPGALFS